MARKIPETEGNGPGMQTGTGFAALHAVATAVLVWSLLPDLSPHAIRELLVQAGEPILKKKGSVP